MIVRKAPAPALVRFVLPLSTGLLLTSLALAGPDNGDPARWNDSSKALSLIDYVPRVDTILLRNFTNSTSTGSATTARGAIEEERTRYNDSRVELEALVPPAELRLAHGNLLKAYADTVAALTRILSTVPATAAASETNKYIYRTAENSYAINDILVSGCDVDVIAKDAGLSMQSAFSCGNEDKQLAVPTNALGTPLQPLTSVSLVHEPFYFNGLPLPRLRYTAARIYARGNTNFSFTFTNNNSAPFLFNLAIYRGNDTVLKRQQLVDSTTASSGPGVVHTLNLKLEPGTYSFIDNVHPAALRGQLIVVK